MLRLIPYSLRSSVLLGVMLTGSLWAQLISDFSALRADYLASVAALSATADKQRADLFDKYANALDNVSKQVAAKGNLDAVLAIKKEQEAARTARKTSGVEIPDIATYRSVLEKTVSGIDTKRQQDTAALTAAYVRKLTATKEALTKANRIDDAVAVDTEIKSVQGQTVASNVPTSMGVKLEGGEPILSEVTALVGLHKPKARVVVGFEYPKEDKKPDGKGTVNTRPGTTIDSGDIFVIEGEWRGEGTLFKRCKLEVDLGGTWTAMNSLFDECSMKKGGHWFVKHASSHWVFDNCAFSRTFFSEWETGRIGVKATHCTFHDVDFNSLTYVEDAGKLVTEGWNTIKDCKFINCKIPESVLIATKDCVFEDCRFEPIESDIKLTTSDQSEALREPPHETSPRARRHQL